MPISIRQFFTAGLVAGIACLSTARAAQVLVKELPSPDPLVMLTGPAGRNLADDWTSGLARTMPHSFRSATDGEFAYVVGRTTPIAGQSNAQSGFISKLSSSGAVVWSKLMPGPNNPAGEVGYVVNDVAILNGALFVCGEAPNGSIRRGFVARLTTDGVLQQIAYMDADDSRAVSLAVTVVGNETWLVVAGDFQGTTLSVRERGGNVRFNNLVGRMDNGSKRDTFVARFDEQLYAKWATTLGFNQANDYAGAVAAGPNGEIFLGMNCENPDGAYNGHVTRDIDDDRRVVSSDNPTGQIMPNGNWTGFNSADGYDLFPGNYSTIIRLDSQNGVNARVTHNAEVCYLDDGETGSDSRVCDLVYSGGFLYAFGEFDGYFRPASTTQSSEVVVKATASPLDKSDLFVGKLNPSNVAWQEYKFVTSAGDDLAEELSVSGSDIYISGIVGGTPTIAGTTPNSTSSARHSFYSKLNSALTHSWTVEPRESASETISIPGFQRHAGIVAMGDKVIISGNYASGNLTFGPDGKRKTLPTTGTQQVGYFGVLKSDGTWMEEVELRILSEFGLPLPFRGTQIVALGQTVFASVAPIIYETSTGSIVDASDAEAIRSQAVTRRICTGYQFRSSQVNGTANQVEFNPSSDTELTFHWRTEHALEIKTNLPAGLTSQAAGLPDPVVNKHWLAAGNPVIAQIDGASVNSDEPGVRFRSTGYTATGSAVPTGGVAGALVPWASYQNRQQVPQFTLTAPVTLTWQWQKEISLRVSTLPIVAGGASTATSSATTGTGDGEFWFPPGTALTLTSPASRDAGRLSLQSYINGTGSVTPSTRSAVDGVLSTAITLGTTSSLTWNYGKTPIPQRVTIGDPIAWTGLPASMVNTRPLAVIVASDAPPGTDSSNSFAWEPLGKRLLPLRPGKYLLEFNDPALDAASTSSDDNLVVEITTGYQGDAVPGATPAAQFSPASATDTYQTFVAGSPAVPLDSSATDRSTWRVSYSLNNDGFAGLALAGGNAAVSETGAFFATEPGTSVLVFTQSAAGNVARGDLAAESVFLRVVRVRLWNDPAVMSAESAVVGTAITPPASHNPAVVGNDGFVVTSRARYNVNFHDNRTLQGPIFPVNTQFTGDLNDKLAVVWFSRDSKIAANWPSSSKDYAVSWPASTPRIVIAGRLGSEGLSGTAAGSEQTAFIPSRFSNLAVYAQNDPALPGYNPNEEHALVAPSFLDASRNAVFALQNTLNRATENASFTSRPFVLAQYIETTGTPAVATPKMAVFDVQWEDAAVNDPRLPEYNRAYTGKYQVEAGKILTPPYPVGTLYLGGWPAGNVVADQDPLQRSAWQDRKKQWWAASGDTDVDTEVDAVFHYPLAGSFWHASKTNGEKVGLHGDDHVFFNTIWPTTIPIMKAGETLTHSGGEAFSDGISSIGLPSVVGMASAQVVYDQANRSLSAPAMGDFWVARVANPIQAVEVDLPLASLPEELRPAGGQIIVDGLLWRFKSVHAGLQQRLYYDPQRGKLGFRGFLNGRTTGDPQLTAAPPAINMLQPNVLTEVEKLAVRALSTDGSWTGAVDVLYVRTRDPVSNTGSRFTVGLDGITGAYELPSQAGLGLALIPNPALVDSAKLSAVGSDGFITIAENNLDSLGDAPIALHVIRIDRTQKFRGAIAPIYPENVFDEKITLRHSGDFDGNTSDLVFQWFYREEDGSEANPPGVAFPNPPGAPAPGKWTLFAETAGLNEISLSGASAALLADNLFFARWRHKDESAVEVSWSQWAGAANSKPPVLTSPSVATDAAYVPQLAEGWIKRVTNSVNAFDARIRDFRNTDAPSTAIGMPQQAGQRWEGAVAFNPSKDAIENYGLIEIYQTVLDRAESLSINLQPGTSGVNTALLNAANRIGQLYTMLGNEASTDAADPTIGFGTQSGQYGSLAPSIFCFQNQTGSLLEEELALLRGRGEVGARPAYNRLLWNFTNGPGQAAYVMNYGITDVNNDGFINASDAAKLYPQSHGDAWGHYTMALRGYAKLFRNAAFAWDSRSEKYQIQGTVFDVDYLDERSFAETAAARAKTGVEIANLVYRQKYTENPAGQWQGYQDTNTDRAWGVYEWSQRAGSGALFDWVTANALLPSKDETKEGIRRVDRTTVAALGELAANAASIQSRLDQADNALNPLGLDSDTVPFDIDPARTDRTNNQPATHFEQIYERALGAAKNAVTAFDHANGASQLLRRTAGTAEQLRQQTIEQDRDYRNRLIEILGTPYQGQIGAGKAYPAGYTGPDLFLFMYADTIEVSKATVPATPKEATIKLEGLMKLATDANPFKDGDQALPRYARDSVTNWFPADYPSGVTEFGGSRFYEFTVPYKTSGYAFKAPADWGVRASPGKVQAALADMLQAEYDMLLATEGYEGYLDDYQRKIRVFTAKTGLAEKDINVVTGKLEEIRSLANWNSGLTQAINGISFVRDSLADLADATKDGLPTGFTDPSFAIRWAIGFGYYGGATVSRVLEAGLNAFIINNERLATSAEINLTIAQTEIAYQVEVIDMLEDLENHINTEPDMRLGIFQATERLRSAGDRYRATLQEGLRLVAEREAFNKKVAATTTLQRYEDFTFRIARNEALGKFRSSYELATRYAWLAGRAYDYELNLPDGHPASAAPVISAMLRVQTLGQFTNGEPVAGSGGLADQLSVLKTNFNVYKGQLGFNSPTGQTVTVSLRTELERIGMASRLNTDWRTQLETYRVADLWNYRYTREGVDYGRVFRRFCRPFAPESAGAQPALVIPFGSTITAGQNWFGKTLTGGDNAFSASSFATKIRAAGVRFDSYNANAMSVTPQVYLVPIGQDRMYLPESQDLEFRSWRVLDQRIPVPLATSASQLSDPGWLPFTGSANGYFEEMRRYPAFRAYNDTGGYSTGEMLQSSRLVGRSVWNTQWVLVIPSNTLLSDPQAGSYPGDPDAGLDTFIHGAPLPGETHSSAGTIKRDGNGVRDIRLLLQTYSVSGN